jgi:hypothetical protein
VHILKQIILNKYKDNQEGWENITIIGEKLESDSSEKDFATLDRIIRELIRRKNMENKPVG